MTVQVKRLDLLAALNKVRWTIGNTKAIPLNRCFCFRDGLVSSYDGMAGTVTACDVGGLEFTVPAETLFRIVQSMTSDLELSLRPTAEMTASAPLFIKSGANETWVATYDPKMFPDLVPDKHTQLNVSDNFVEALSDAAFTAGHNVTKPQLLGLTVQNGYVYSSDGPRITRVKLNSTLEQTIRLPVHAVKHICQLGLPDYVFTGEGLFGCRYSDSKTIYVTRVTDGDFPVSIVESMVLAAPVLVELPEDIAKVVQRVAIMAPTMDPDLILESDGSKLSVRTRTQDGGASEDIEWVSGLVFKTAVRPRYLLEALTKTRSVDMAAVIEGKRPVVHFVADGIYHLMTTMVVKE